jgi:hypothetical protein
MKLKAPVGCCAASHGGRAVPFAEDGTIDVDDKVALVFIAHGFRPIEMGQGTHVAKLKTVETCSPPNANPVIPNTGSDGIEALSRKELFAFLRAKGVSVCLPITNNELRAAVRRSLGS